MRPRRLALPAALLPTAITGCAAPTAPEKGSSVQTQSRAEVEAATRAHLARAIAMVPEGKPDPAEPRIAPAPCDGPGDGSAPDGRFRVTGFGHVTLPADRHRPVLAQVRERAETAGYEVVSFRDLPGDSGGELRLRTPADDFTLSWASSGDRVWLGLIVMSPCVSSPDGSYPG